MFSPPMTKKLYAKLGNGKKVLIKEYNSNGTSNQIASNVGTTSAMSGNMAGSSVQNQS